MLRFSLFCFSLLTACTAQQEAPPHKEKVIDYDAETSQPDDSTDTSTSTTTHPLLSQSLNDTPLESMLWSAGEVEILLNENTLSGSLQYREWWDDTPNEPSCTATLLLTGNRSDEACDSLFPENDWCYTFELDIDTQEGECIYPSEDTSFTISSPEIVAFVAYSSSHTSDDGSTLSEHFAIGYHSDQGHSYITPNNGWDATTSNLNFTVGEIGQHYPNLYQECGQWSDLTASELWITNDAIEDVLVCGNEEVADLWNLTLEAGDRITASIDTQIDGVELRLGLISPEGCLLGDVWPAAPCSSGHEDCPSLTYQTQIAGNYQLFVTSDWCGDASSISYAIDAQRL